MSNPFGIETRNITLEINDDDGVKSGMTIELCPHDDRRVLRAERKIADMISTSARKKGANFEEIITTRLAAHIVSWKFSEGAQWNGNPIPGLEFTEDNCIATLKNPTLRTIREQVAEAIEDRARFSRRADSSAD